MRLIKITTQFQMKNQDFLRGIQRFERLEIHLKNDTPEIYCIYFSMKRFVLSANNAER